MFGECWCRIKKFVELGIELFNKKLFLEDQTFVASTKELSVDNR